MSAHRGKPLLSTPQADYGDSYRDHLFEQYKMLVESAQHTSDLRHSANNYLVAVNSALVSLFGVVSTRQCPRTIHFIVPVAGVLVSIFWCLLICSYRRLNTAKFVAIHEFEALLPTAPYRREWDILTENGHKPISSLEGWIPGVFIAINLALAVYAFWC